MAKRTTKQKGEIGLRQKGKKIGLAQERIQRECNRLSVQLSRRPILQRGGERGRRRRTLDIRRGIVPGPLAACSSVASTCLGTLAFWVDEPFAAYPSHRPPVSGPIKGGMLGSIGAAPAGNRAPCSPGCSGNLPEKRDLSLRMLTRRQSCSCMQNICNPVLVVRGEGARSQTLVTQPLPHVCDRVDQWLLTPPTRSSLPSRDLGTTRSTLR